MLVLDVFLSSWSFPSVLCLCDHDQNNTPLFNTYNVHYLLGCLLQHSVIHLFLQPYMALSFSFIITPMLNYSFFLDLSLTLITWLVYFICRTCSRTGKIHVSMLINTISLVDDLLFGLFPRVCCHVLYSTTSNALFSCQWHSYLLHIRGYYHFKHISF